MKDVANPNRPYNKWLRYAPLALIVLMFIVSFVTFVLSLFGWDTKVFSLSANLANYIGKNLFYDAYNEWEIKGVFNRVSIYAIYKIATLFTDFGTIQFEKVSKLIYACIIVGISAMSVALVSKGEKIRKLSLTLFLSTTFLATSVWNNMQTEMTCSLLLVLSFALYINAEKAKSRERLKLLLAGCLIASTFYFKSSVIIISPVFVAAAYLWDVNHNCKPSWEKFFLLIAGGTFMLAIGLASILLLNPEEIQDMINASIFEKSLLHGGVITIKQLYRFFYRYLESSRQIPFLMVGTVAYYYNVALSIKERDYLSTAMHFILWFLPTLFIAISNCYFVYHYLTFMFPALFEVALFAEKDGRISDKISIAILVIFLASAAFAMAGFAPSFLANVYCLILYILLFKVVLLSAALAAILSWERVKRAAMTVSLLVAGVLYITLISLFSVNFSANIDLTEEAFNENAKFSTIDFDEPVLYLDDGPGAYFLGADSYLKYSVPLPIMKIAEDSPYKNVECRVKTLKTIYKYSGEYITLDKNWIYGSGKNQKNKKIRKKIEKEYEKVGDIVRYVPETWNILEPHTKSDFSYIGLYKRKDSK